VEGRRHAPPQRPLFELLGRVRRQALRV